MDGPGVSPTARRGREKEKETERQREKETIRED